MIGLFRCWLGVWLGVGVVWFGPVERVALLVLGRVSVWFGCFGCYDVMVVLILVYCRYGWMRCGVCAFSCCGGFWFRQVTWSMRFFVGLV